MPTGYTAGLTTDSSFRAFALDIARMFGALIHMRDQPSSAPLTLPEASDHHERGLAKAEAELVKLRKMTTKQLQNAATRAYKKAVESNEGAVADATAKRAAYSQMLAQANAWVPPTPDHVGMKAEMIRQLEESDKWDNGILDKPRAAPVHLTGEQWFKEAEKQYNWEVDYHTKGAKEESERTAERRKWITDLQASL